MLNCTKFCLLNTLVFVGAAALALAAGTQRDGTQTDRQQEIDSSSGLLASVEKVAYSTNDVDFNRDIRPILSSKCFLCHGPDEGSREAGLRLDSFADATEDLGGYSAIVPGNPDESEMLARILEEDEDLRMPPSEHGAALTDKEKDLVTRWIQSGAKFDKHWAYKRVAAPEIPNLKSPWTKNSIDQFVLRKLQEKGLEPSPSADRYSLIRRIALDLTGLPPSVEKAEEFANDPSENAVEKIVDYYLAQPGFGERWAAMWLDQARYADTMGYAEDRPREIWAYRDYVIRSFNENKSFADFTQEQLAGDLLPNPSESDLIATAFHRNTLNNSEGGTIDEEFRSAAVVDRTNTTMAVWMGTTMACAQCHAHKYDPISQEEYFQFYAFFNGTADNDQPSDAPKIDVFSDEQKARRSELQSQIAALQTEVKLWGAAEKQDELRQLQKAWELNLRERKKDDGVDARYARVELPRTNAILSIAEVKFFHKGKELGGLSQPAKTSQSSTYYGAKASLAVDGIVDGNFNNKSVTHTRRENRPWWEIDFGQQVRMDEVQIWHRTDSNQQRRSDGLVLTILDGERKELARDRIEKVAVPSDRVALGPAPIAILELVDQRQKRTKEQDEQVANYFLTQVSPVHRLKRNVAELETKLAGIQPVTRVPVLRELPEPRETFVHIRGSYAIKGEQVDRRTPSAFHPLKSETRSRLDLANWLVSRDNPLTARVMVNRFWQQLFGVGIVSSSEEFGAQGEWPTHPELLDHLAAEFMESGWDIKSLLKKICLSATYQQSSKATPERKEADPFNRFLSRGPRFRLSAEMIRDQALFSSGLMSKKMYGPPVQPPQPKTGLTAAFSARGTDWQDATGENRYRRAIYTKWQRSNPYPSMTTFDVSNREVCELQRIRTNTPLQALVTLNDPAFIEAAQALSRRSLGTELSIEETATRMFRLVMVRPPTEEELSALVALYQDTQAGFESDMEAAKELGNDPLNPLPDDTDWSKMAAWTAVANVVLNLDEALMRR